MDGPGNQFFSRAVFTKNKDIRIGGSYFLNGRLDLLHRRTVANKPLELRIQIRTELLFK